MNPYTEQLQTQGEVIQEWSLIEVLDEDLTEWLKFASIEKVK